MPPGCSIDPFSLMKTLLVLLGPTGVGKTEWSLSVAEALRCPIISADSRQLYRGLSVGTAAPTPEQMQRVPHHFVGILAPTDYYNASDFEREVLSLLARLHQEHRVVIMSGGSMMYIDVVCRGIDEIPNIDEALRSDLQALYRTEGLDPIRQQLKILDPVFYNEVDLKNPKRVIHALEVCLMTGKPYSSLRTNPLRERPFRIVKVGLTRDREELYDRINRRVDQMVADGLVEEARGLFPMRHLNALNTVGYKELFAHFKGECTLEFAIEKIKQHSRNYARKQLSWFRRDKEIHWINLSREGVNVVQGTLSLLDN